VGQRGAGPPSGMVHGVGCDVILSERRGQSQKPEELYELIEELVPRGKLRPGAATGICKRLHRFQAWKALPGGRGPQRCLWAMLSESPSADGRHVHALASLGCTQGGGVACSGCT
jgi:hypothetical protein